ncbi:iron ABC transporter substrate-binding protein [Pandoraea vervacti]|uniref:Iron ABC transporter substrate-binding protein n=1 Tax=Pandoraea vervacti TaxID=656178 RepID=A0ABN4FUC8_9BURK|nr:ABC transporter substrate-binding protein [Pandoraea vervacti]AJP59410.1 iron ABC transporter substrate-binding protein [Pandoraea vervacti]
MGSMALTAMLVSNAGRADVRYPITVQSCNRAVTFERAPQRAVSNDVNLTEMMLALGLKSRMVGFTGISGWKTGNAALRRQLAGLPELAQRYPSMEVLVQAGADFYFAGWNYGMHVGGPVTPAMLAPMGIRTYELSESCGHVMPRGAASFDDVYNDLRNLGRIFDVEPAASAIIDRMRSQLETLTHRVGAKTAPVRTFVYDSGEDSPFTAGRLAMPTALIEAAGGRNVMDDVMQSWTRVSWETVVARNPQAIVVVDYGAVTAAQKIAFLLDQPALRKVEAVRARRFIVVPYDEATPGIRNAQAVETIARGLYPKAFPK